MSNSVLLKKCEGHVATLVLNRPESMNALNLALIERLRNALESIADDDNIRVLVVTGSGPAFCAGADLHEVLATQDLPPGEPDFIDRVVNDVMNVLRDFPKPVIAAINGTTMAGGLELAMCCDIIVAAEDAQIGDAHANFGVFPGAGGAAILPRLVPQNVAKYLLLTGKTLSAAQLHSFGLVNEIHPAAQLLDKAHELAAQIAQKSPIALRRMKEVANRSLDNSRDAALAHEQALMRQHMRSYDMDEGLRAFGEKRKPEFKGK